MSLFAETKHACQTSHENKVENLHLYKNVVFFSAEAGLSYFSVDFRLKIFL